MHVSFDDPLHETEAQKTMHNAQAYHDILESEHVEKVCFGFVHFE